MSAPTEVLDSWEDVAHKLNALEAENVSSLARIAELERELAEAKRVTFDVRTIEEMNRLERENKKLNRCVDLAIRIFRENGNHGYVKAMEELAASEKENEHG